MAFDPRLRRIYDLSPRDFELLIADIWQERQGWDTEVTDAGADGGVDILGYPPEGGAPTAVQAKRYHPEKKNVGRPKVQQYAALRQQYTDIEGITIVTTSEFTSGAEQAADRLDVTLIDGEALLTIIDRDGAQDIVDWYAAGKPEV